MAEPLTRRTFLGTAGAALGTPAAPLGAAEFPVKFRKASPYEPLFEYVDPRRDGFEVEKRAAEIEARLQDLPRTPALPLDEGFDGVSPMPARYRGEHAEYDAKDRDFAGGLRRWLASLGVIRRISFYVLARDRVRYEVASSGQYRTGHWEMQWRGGKLRRFRPLGETLVTVREPLFTDVTGGMFGSTDSFRRQLRYGTPYWRSRLDSACGIDVYGSNGIAAGDIDGDGFDEIYVCQPGGLPNRLYRVAPAGIFEDITERAGVGVLDETASALVLDLRNSGQQDLVVLAASGPQLFINAGEGRFRHAADAFRFATPPRGSFTGMSAADYDRDGRLDLYLCTYVYFQSEDQYRYPTPYHDAQNGPPNFLFRNRLNGDGSGGFEDVTEAAELNQNNSRFSFAAAWCDYDGDGWPDLYVANDFGRNNLYRNERGRFRDVAAQAGVEDIGPGMGASWFDYDSDGRPDLYVANMWTAAGQRVTQSGEFGPLRDGAPAEAYRRHTKGNSLYRNRGDGGFEETSAAEGVEMGRWAWCAEGYDFDLDGTPEIAITAGMITNPGPARADLESFFWRRVVAGSPGASRPAPDYENGWNAINQLIREDCTWSGRQPNVFYVRRGGRYVDASGVSGFDFADDSRAFAITDFDGDGRPDLLLKSRLGPQVRALRNNCSAGRNTIAVELRGTSSNRDAVGARVEVAHEGGRSVQWLQAGSGYLAQHTKLLHFGLGASRLARLRVRWPSGLEQEFGPVQAGFRYRLTEGSAETRELAFAPRRPPPGDMPAAVNEHVFGAAWLVEPLPLPEARRGPGLLCVSDTAVAGPRGVPFELVDLRTAPPDTAAAYAIIRRYLFDYRTGLRLPLVLLIDGRGAARKIYRGVPDAQTARNDLARLSERDSLSLALPFPGRYFTRPRRNYYRMGGAFFYAGYPAQAAIYLNELVRRDPRNFKAHLALGQIHLDAGRLEAARPHLRAALSLNDASPEVWNNLGGLEMAQHNYARALENFNKALALAPDLPYALANAGQAHSRLGNAAEAERLLKRALALDASDADTANQLGLLLARGRRYEEAAALFRQAIAARRDHGGALNNLGVLYMETGKTNDAVAAFRYGIEVAPDEESLYVNLARVYARTGEAAKAREIVEQLLARRPASEAGRKAMRELGALP